MAWLQLIGHKSTKNTKVTIIRFLRVCRQIYQLLQEVLYEIQIQIIRKCFKTGPVTIFHNEEHVDYEVLVDSGSDHCFFDSEIGEDIGISKSNSEVKEVFGVGGKISLYYNHEITLKVGDKTFKTDVGFIPNLGGNIVSYGIVGQKSFFEKFIVKFDYLKEEIELKYRK